MRVSFFSGCLRLLLTAILFATGACDDEASAIGDGGTDAGTDTDTDSDTDVDTDTDTDTDSDSDTDPDGGELECEVDPDRIFEDLEYFASEDLGGREAGTEGNDLAMQAAEALFEELGLEPVGDDGTYRQAFSYTKPDYLDAPSIVVDGESLDGCGDYAVFDGSGSGDVTEEIVYVGYGITVPPYDTGDYPGCSLPSTGYDDYAGIDVTGKVALVVRHGPDDDMDIPDECPDGDLCTVPGCLLDFGAKAANAELHGAAAMILVNHYGASAEHEGGTFGEVYIEDFPAVWVDRDIIEAAVPDLETWTDGIDGALEPDPHATGVEATVSASMGIRTVATANVIGAIQGTDPEIGDEVVIVGGHVDHMGNDVCLQPGADDNASGATLTMELARLISKCANPARTIVFALWNGEEDGLLGSIHYVENPIYSIDSTVAMYSIDMVGAGQDTNLVLYGAVDDANAWLAQVMEGSAAEMGYTWAVTPGEVSEWSDHYPFAYAGVPAVCAMSGLLETHDYYHTPADTSDSIGLSHLEMSASMMYAGLKPLVEGTEEIYLTSGKAMLEGVAPAPVDPDNRLVRDR